MPAEGIETTVDDEVACKVLDGSLEDYPVPYHPPPITGSGVGVLGGLLGASLGALRIAGTGTPAGQLVLSANQPPSTVAVLPDWMQTGKWIFTFVASSTGVQRVLLCTDLNHQLTAQASGEITLSLSGAAFATTVGCTWSASQSVTVTVDWIAQALTVSGATTGNGTTAFFGGSGPYSWPAGGLNVGQLPGFPAANFVGSFSDIARLAGGTTGPSQAGLTGSASGTVGSTAITGAAAATQAGLTGAASGAQRLTGTAAGIQGGLVGAAAQATSISGTAAGAQAGLTGAAAGAQRIGGTGAGAQSGLTGAAAGALRIAGTGAGAQSGLTGAASGGLRVGGTGAGAQAGLVGSAAGTSDEMSFLEDYLAKNLFSWMRADTRTEASSRVTQFTDRVTLVGNVRANARTVSSTHAFTQATATSAAQVPAITTSALLNGKEAALFTTSQNYVSNIAATNWKFLHDGTGMEMWAALAPTVGSTGNDQTIATTVDTVAGMAMFRAAAGQDIYLYSHDGTNFLANPGFGTVLINASVYVDAQIRVSDTPDYNYRFNSTSNTTGNLAVGTPASVAPDHSLRIGFDGTAGRVSNMALGEIMVASVVDSTLLTRVQRYMLLRYGLA